MFSADILEKIFTNEKASKVPIVYQSTMIKVIESILDEKEKEDATIRKSVSVSTTNVSEHDVSTTDAITVDTESYNGYQW